MTKATAAQVAKSKLARENVSSQRASGLDGHLDYLPTLLGSSLLRSPLLTAKRESALSEKSRRDGVLNKLPRLNLLN
jgi:hypothetical protein